MANCVVQDAYSWIVRGALQLCQGANLLRATRIVDPLRTDESAHVARCRVGGIVERHCVLVRSLPALLHRLSSPSPRRFLSMKGCIGAVSRRTVLRLSMRRRLIILGGKGVADVTGVFETTVDRAGAGGFPVPMAMDRIDLESLRRSHRRSIPFSCSISRTSRAGISPSAGSNASTASAWSGFITRC